MRLISCHNGKLQELAEIGLKNAEARSFKTSIAAIDRLAPGEVFSRGAVHEILSRSDHETGTFFAAILAGGAAGMNTLAPIIWCDPRKRLYPPALASLGIDLANLYVLHPRDEADEAWAVAECLRCKGVGAVIASPERLSRIAARKLQLAAETGQSAAILLRRIGPGSNIYAAATRWLVMPHPGERTIRRWKIQLVHGHGGRIGQSVFLEHCRETGVVRAAAELADRPAAPPDQKITA
jgi:protein ImuA